MLASGDNSEASTDRVEAGQRPLATSQVHGNATDRGRKHRFQVGALDVIGVEDDRYLRESFGRGQHGEIGQITRQSKDGITATEAGSLKLPKARFNDDRSATLPCRFEAIADSGGTVCVGRQNSVFVLERMKEAAHGPEAD